MSNERFILESRLDQGRFGTVYRAIDTRESFDGRPRTVALWLLPPEFTCNKPALELFRRDYLRIRELAHPAIARVYELGQDRDRVFITSELLDGETLRNVLDHLRPEKLDTEEADEVISVVGDALAYAHELGIVHADVRAENVLVTTDHEIKLLNLMSTSLMRSSAFTGGPAGDVRDLASLAYELYTGEPFAPDAQRKRIKGASKRRVRAIERALADPPARPFANAREFLIDTGLARAPVSYYASPRSAAPVRTRDRSAARRLAIPIAGAAALALGIYSGGNLDTLLETVPIDRWLAALPDGTDDAPVGDARTEIAPTIEARPETREYALEERARFNAASGRSEDAGTRSAGPGRPGKPASVPPTSEQLARAEPLEEPRVGEAQLEAPAADEPERVDGAIAEGAPEAAAGDANSERGAAPRPASFALSASAVTAYESQTSVMIDIVRSGSSTESAQIIWWTEDGSARSGDDYASFGRRVETFEPGETVRTLHIPITSDALPERDEHFFVRLDDRSTLGPTGEPATATVTLIDDD